MHNWIAPAAGALMVALDVETAVRAVDLFIEQGVVYVFRGGRVEKHS